MSRRRAHAPLRVLLNNRPVGRLNKAATGAIDFQYEPAWLDWEYAMPVSLSVRGSKNSTSIASQVIVITACLRS